MIGRSDPEPDGSPPMGPRVLDRDETRRDLALTPPAPRVLNRQESGPVSPDVPVAAPAQPTKSSRRRRGLDWAVLATVLGLGAFAVERLIVDAVNWIALTYERNAVLAIIAGATLAAGSLGALFIVVRELRGFFAIRTVEALQGKFEKIDQISIDAADQFIAGVLATLRSRPESRADIAAFERRIGPQHTPAQRIEILSQTVLLPLDRRAEAAVRSAASRAFGITAISPNVLTHALFFLVLCIRMMREVTAAYGHRPTATTTLHLLRRLVVEAGKVGGIDIAVAAMGTHLLTGLVEKVGVGAAESAYAAQRMARLGIITMAMCRPVLFRDEEIPSLSSLVGNLMQRSPGA